MRVAQGLSDEAVAAQESLSLVAVSSCIRRFRERTGLAGRALTVWAVRHEGCCVASGSQDARNHFGTFSR
jgi:hypothetical protein